MLNSISIVLKLSRGVDDKPLVYNEIGHYLLCLPNY